MSTLYPSIALKNYSKETIEKRVAELHTYFDKQGRSLPLTMRPVAERKVEADGKIMELGSVSAWLAAKSSEK